MTEFLESLAAVLGHPLFWALAGGVALIEFAVAVAIKCKTPRSDRPVSQLSNAGTREIRRLRSGQ